ncbi:MAG: hypothetical protein JWN64_790 [Parcubacteria group bacterium]|nr:hypothetical protein [Parcubacteria group bacterium]
MTERFEKSPTPNSFLKDLAVIEERAEAHDSNVERVSMNEGAALQVLPTDTQEKILLTRSLNGCTCLVIVGEHEDGTREALMTHYPQVYFEDNRDKLHELSEATRIALAKQKHATAFVVGEMKGGKLQPASILTAGMLPALVASELGADTTLQVIPYAESTLAESREGNGSLVVRIPPAGSGNPNYKAWFTSGDLV